ncbi:MAG: hypothetical protein Q9182_003751 [Xanthomendoza sp. 2 TL-2023]
MFRRTRFVCISDTHNAAPDASFKLPAGHVLIHAGDLTNQGKYTELRKTLDWIEKADFEVKIVVAGNHDITLDPAFYEQHGAHHHGQHLQDAAACRTLVEDYPSLTFLNHEYAELTLKKPDGPRTTFKVFGSPMSPARGVWAFGYQPAMASKLWDSIPLDTDVLVTHTPPNGHCDASRDRGPAGCKGLQQALGRVRPSLAVCGHVHEGRGVERVVWDLHSPSGQCKEQGVGYWHDPGAGNKKQSLVDLSSRSLEPLQSSRWIKDEMDDRMFGWGSTDVGSANKTCSWKFHDGPFQSEIGSSANEYKLYDEPPTATDAGMAVSLRPSVMPSEEGQSPMLGFIEEKPTPASSNTEILGGPLGRKETCIINAAIMATSWPHKAVNGRGKYNKPIVVDIDLPTWDTS